MTESTSNPIGTVSLQISEPPAVAIIPDQIRMVTNFASSANPRLKGVRILIVDGGDPSLDEFGGFHRRLRHAECFSVQDR